MSHWPRIMLGCSLFGIKGHPEVKFWNFSGGISFLCSDHDVCVTMHFEVEGHPEPGPEAKLWTFGGQGSSYLHGVIMEFNILGFKVIQRSNSQTIWWWDPGGRSCIGISWGSVQITILGSKVIQRSNFQTWVMGSVLTVEVWIMIEVNTLGYPSQKWISDAICVQLWQQSLVAFYQKLFQKSSIARWVVRPSSRFEVKSCVVWRSRVTVERLALNPCCLSTKIHVQFFKMLHNMRMDIYVPISCRWCSSKKLDSSFLVYSYWGFLKILIILASRHCLGKIPLSTELWKILVSIGASSSAAIFKNHGGSWSGPGALLGARFFSCFNTPSELIISRGTSSTVKCWDLISIFLGENAGNYLELQVSPWHHWSHCC